METNDFQIRYVWHPETLRWNYSIVDVIDSIIDTADARNYWKVLKNRLKKRGNPVADSCNQLKMKARDGKLYNTDVADAHIIIQIIRVVTDTIPPHLETWIVIRESKIPDQKPSELMLSKKSFPQVRKLNVNEVSKRVNRNRLKDFFKVELVK